MLVLFGWGKGVEGRFSHESVRYSYNFTGKEFRQDIDKITYPGGRAPQSKPAIRKLTELRAKCGAASARSRKLRLEHPRILA